MPSSRIDSGAELERALGGESQANSATLRCERGGADSALQELCDFVVRLEEEQRSDDLEHSAYRERRRVRTARTKEVNALILAHMSESDVDRHDAGDRVFTRDAKAKIKVTKTLVKKFMGADAFREYADCASNVRYEERMRVSKKRRRRVQVSRVEAEPSPD